LADERGITIELEQPMATAARRAHVLNRLKSIDGHLRGVIRMVEDDTYCIDVIRQLQAVEGAIGRVASLMLEDHLNTCVTDALQGDDATERTRVIGELLRLYEAGARTPLDIVDATVAAVPDGVAQ
jgi:DNA-binding FrmR family transcriptional regulator